MKKLFILLVALLGLNCANAQYCLPEGIWFSTQAQISNFVSDHPGCSQIEGNVIISGYTITDLDGLSVLTAIGGSLMIECNEALASLAGLHNLTAIGGNLYLEGNLVLTSLAGLDHVTFIGGDVELTNNVALINLTGLEGLTSVNGKLWIDDNESLTSLSGLGNVATTAGVVRIYSNNSLENLSGLEGLTSIGGCLIIGGQGHLGGVGNPSLTSLMGLYNVTSIGGMIDIGYNSSLSDLAGLDNINAGSICSLFIYENDTLKSCAVQSICDYINDPNGTVFISNNATGCNDQGEVGEACIRLSETGAVAERIFSAYPNPSSGCITIEMKSGPANGFLVISDLTGQEIVIQNMTDSKTQIDLSSFPAGIYFAKLNTNNTYEAVKLIKQ